MIFLREGGTVLLKASVKENDHTEKVVWSIVISSSYAGMIRIRLKGSETSISARPSSDTPDFIRLWYFA